MIEFLKKLLRLHERIYCLHEYENVDPLKYGSYSRVLYQCNKCGKMSFFMDDVH